MQCPLADRSRVVCWVEGTDIVLPEVVDKFRTRGFPTKEPKISGTIGPGGCTHASPRNKPKARIHSFRLGLVLSVGYDIRTDCAARSIWCQVITTNQLPLAVIKSHRANPKVVHWLVERVRRLVP